MNSGRPLRSGQTPARTWRNLGVGATLLASISGAIYHRSTRDHSTPALPPAARAAAVKLSPVSAEPLPHMAELIELDSIGRESRSITVGRKTKGTLRGRLLQNKILVANGRQLLVNEDRTFSCPFDAAVDTGVVFSSPDAEGTVELDLVLDTAGPTLQLTIEQGELGTVAAPTRAPPTSVKIRVDDISHVEEVTAWLERDGIRVDLRVDHHGDHAYRASIPEGDPYEGTVEFVAQAADEWGQTTKQSLTLAIDTTPPSLEVVWYALAERALGEGGPGEWLIKIRSSEPIAEPRPATISLEGNEATILFTAQGETPAVISVADGAGNRSEPTSLYVSDDPASKDYSLLEAYWKSQATWIGSVLDPDLVDGWPRLVENRIDGMVLAFVPARTFAITQYVAPLTLVRGVYLATTEVSRGQYAQFIRQGDVSDKMPAHNVTFDQAAGYAKWAGGRLPRAVEMLAASTWGSGPSKYPWGNEPPEDEFVHKYAVVSVLARPKAKRVPVDTLLPPGCYGHQHLAGNVSEWCVDQTQNGRIEIANLGREPESDRSEPGDRRVTFGASYADTLAGCENASPLKAIDPNSTYPFLGFRYVISP